MNNSFTKVLIESEHLFQNYKNDDYQVFHLLLDSTTDKKHLNFHGIDGGKFYISSKQLNQNLTIDIRECKDISIIASNRFNMINVDENSPAINVLNGGLRTLIKGFNIASDGNGIEVRDSFESQIYQNKITKCKTGIQVRGKTNFHDIQNNSISNFSQDGLRVLSDNTQVLANLIFNARKSIKGNHLDLIQLFPLNSGKTLSNITIADNFLFNNSKDNEDFLAQGIMATDGTFSHLNIHGNRILVDHWHGISIDKAMDCWIRDNIIGSNHHDRKPWIKIFNEWGNNDIDYNMVHRAVINDESIYFADDFDLQFLADEFNYYTERYLK